MGGTANPRSFRGLLPVALALGGGLAACQRYDAQAGAGRPVIERIDGPFLEMGSELDAVLEVPVGTDTNQLGDPFRAQVVAPVRAATGEVLIAAGARVEGRVTWVDRNTYAIGIKLDTVETVRGRASLHGTIDRIGDYAYSALQPTKVAQSAFDVVLRPAHRAAIGGGPPEEQGKVAEEWPPFRIPAGAPVHIVLLDRVVPPGVAVERPPRELVEPTRRTTEPPIQQLPGGAAD